jgi:phenol 2-monooxygenase
MNSVLLARYGITSVLTVDEKSQQVHAGQADGIQPRTLEVLQSLDLAHEVLTQGCHMREVGFWNPSKDGKGIIRTSFVPDVGVPARYPHEVTIHQGRIERILNEDLEKNGNRVQRGWKVLGWEFDYGDEEFPVVVKLQGEGRMERVVKAKHLVGADGAHSVVREGMGLKLVGDHTDHVWGVVDSVVKTDFPDIRKRCAIHSNTGSIMIIPRERVSGNKVLTRVYCQMEDEVERDATVTNESAPTKSPGVEDAKKQAKKRRENVSLKRIVSQTKKVLEPYKIEFGDVDWWAAYQIGQRATAKFSLADAHGILRVHIAGDACHTHSPKAGQGMNVSMMDGYNLSWKLAHALNGLTPTPNDLIATYELERLDIARQLIEFDTKFSSMFSGKIGDEVTGLTHEQFVDVFSTGSGFTSGCGIKYVQGLLVARELDKGTVLRTGAPTEAGLLVPGRRILNVKTKRFADANPRDIHDDMPSTGRYRIIVLLPAQFKANPAAFSEFISTFTDAIPSYFAQGAVETVTVFPGERGSLEWTDFPDCVKEASEWLVLGDHYGEVYKTWGVDENKGALAVVRPDGYVGAVTSLEGQKEVVGFLESVLKIVW